MTIAGRSVNTLSRMTICMGTLAAFDAGSVENEMPRSESCAAYTGLARANAANTSQTHLGRIVTAFVPPFRRQTLPGVAHSQGNRSATLWVRADQKALSTAADEMKLVRGCQPDLSDYGQSASKD